MVGAMQSTDDGQAPRGGKVPAVPRGLKLAYATGEITDMIAYQGFSFLIFTFYSVVLGLNVNIVTVVYIAWSIFNAFNDPVLGALSDRTRTRRLGGGRRRPWMLAMLAPLALVMIFLFMPPPPAAGQVIVGIYMLAIMMLFDTFYTAYSLNHTSLYPEMFRTDKAREEAGTARRIFMVFGLVIAFALPSFFIDEYVGDPAVATSQYQLTGAVFGIIIAATIAVHVAWGVREPSVDTMKTRPPLGFVESLKVTLRNRRFLVFVGASTACWYVFTLLPLLMPLYTAVVLGESDAFMTTLLLLIGFVSTIPGVLVWEKVDHKIGSKRGMAISMAWWAAFFVPFLFITEFTHAAILMVFVGIGLAGPTYFIDRNISNIADEDQLATNDRREASYYGVHAIFIRLAAILVIMSVNIVFNYSGWEIIEVSSPTAGQVLGVQLLMSLFPAAALGAGLAFLAAYPLGNARVREIQARLAGGEPA